LVRPAIFEDFINVYFGAQTYIYLYLTVIMQVEKWKTQKLWKWRSLRSQDNDEKIAN